MVAEQEAVTRTKMAQEIAEIPDVAEGQVRDHMAAYIEAGTYLASTKPTALLTCARGSSDHAALYLKYLLEIEAGIPVCSMGPSIASQYKTRLNLDSVPLVAISQSGGSRDICDLAQAAEQGGSKTLALINVSGSSLESNVQHTLPLGAGEESAVAATKSFVASLVASAGLVAGWVGNEKLIDALRRLPEKLAVAVESDWSVAVDAFAEANGAFVISRGPGFAIAMEAALKLKETCQFHAEAYSAAEVRHGPVALAKPGFLVLSFATHDATSASLEEAEAFFRSTSSRVLTTSNNEAVEDRLPIARSEHSLLDPICQIASFYRFVEQLSARYGLNPDAPDNLKKVTVTK